MSYPNVIAYSPADSGVLICADCAAEWTDQEREEANADFDGAEVDTRQTCDGCLEVIDGYHVLCHADDPSFSIGGGNGSCDCDNCRAEPAGAVD